MGVVHATRRVLAPVGTALIVIASSSALAGATYRIAEIDEVTVSCDGDAAVQFVNGTKLTAFDAEGNLSSVVLPVNGNVASGGC